jgi:hypothetical protein
MPQQPLSDTLDPVVQHYAADALTAVFENA